MAVGFRQSHIRDGAALARYFAWLEEQLNNDVELNESQAADQVPLLLDMKEDRLALVKAVNSGDTDLGTSFPFLQIFR